MLTDLTDDPRFIKMAFMVFKMLAAIQRDTGRQSQYWDMLKVANPEERWDSVN